MRKRRSSSIGLGSLIVTIMALGILLCSAGGVMAAPQYTVTCTTCHQMPPVDSATSGKDPFTGGVPGNHQAHATSTTASCAKCHGSAVNTYATGHRNKAIELDGGLGYSRGFVNQTSVPPNPLGTCSTAVCHSDGKGNKKTTPAWASTAFQAPADCNQCHDVAPATGNHPVSGSKHAAYYGTGTGSCVKCHSDHLAEGKPFSHATSAGRNIDVRFTAAPNSGGTFGSNQCSNLYCHSDGKSGSPNVVPTWGGSLDCAGCHGDATTAGKLLATGKHQAHVNNAAVLGTNYGCAECHAKTVSGNTTISDVTKHVNTFVDFSGAKAGSVVAGTCATAYCHSDGKGTQKSVNWAGGTTLDCKGCHGSGTSTAAGEPTYANGGAGTLMANSHGKHVTVVGDCIKCHNATINADGTLKAGSSHTNKTIDVVADGTLASFTTGADKTCSNISCHSGGGIISSVGTAQWGSTLDCQGCHSTLSSAHAKHLTAYGCVDCHNASVTDNTTIKTGGLHMNSALNVVGANITSVDIPNNTCTTSCHTGAAPNWTNASTGACGSCHDATSPLISSNAHGKHFNTTVGPGIAGTVAGCQVCHVYSGETTHVSGSGTVGMQGGFSKLGSCSTCHTRTTTDWTSAATITCESCHTTTGGALSQISGVTAPDKTEASASGHGKAGIAVACTTCHDNTSAHISGTLGDSKRLQSALGTGNTNCSYCHNDPAKVTNVAKRITQVHVGFANQCSVCHDPHGKGNANMIMANFSTNRSTTVAFSGSNFVNASGTGVCQACHTNTTYYKKDVAETNHYDVNTNCLECHTHAGADGLTAFEPSRSCDSCHGYPPVPRNVAGLTFGTMNNWSTARFEDYSGGGGAHILAAHVPKTAKASDADPWANCIMCHNEGPVKHAKALPLRSHVANVTVKVDPQYRFSNSYFISYTGAKLVDPPATNVTGSCFNVACHIGPSPRWSTER